jgi:formamidopyrimidine-DNA glycosylase
MPELPEVETVVRSLRPHVVGRTILSAEVRSRRVTRQDFAMVSAALAGRQILGVRRQGKQIFIDLDIGVLYVHLGMTGKLLWDAKPGKYTRAILDLEKGILLFDDVRQFGRFEYYASIPEFLTGKGPDALAIDFETFHSRLRQRRGAIKALLLNQSFLAGVGNIYADELLFAARVHPKTSVSHISKRRSAIIHRQLLEILRQAIDLRGSSISDYVDASGTSGDFQRLHRVYGRAGKPCPVCGAPIRRAVIAQRGTHYCPRCQRA